jgi:hypothetical protein
MLNMARASSTYARPVCSSQITYSLPMRLTNLNNSSFFSSGRNATKPNSFSAAAAQESWPQSVITQGFLVGPLAEPCASIAWTTSEPCVTWPKTTCLPSSHGVGTVVRKNCSTSHPLSSEHKSSLKTYASLQARTVLYVLTIQACPFHLQQAVGAVAQDHMLGIEPWGWNRSDAN